MNAARIHGHDGRSAVLDSLVEFDHSTPGVTEAFMSTMLASDGDDVYDWLLNALPTVDHRTRLVDLGCGTGALAQRLPKCKYVGIDASLDDLRKARERRPGRLFVQADACNIEWVATTADVVACSLALQLMQPLPDVLRAVASTLRPGGVTVATIPDSASLPASDRDLRQALRTALGSGYTDPNAALLQHLGRLFEDAGLQVVDDLHRRFTLTIVGPAEAMFVAATHAPKGTPVARVAAASDVLLDRGPVEWPMSVRRVTALANRS